MRPRFAAVCVDDAAVEEDVTPSEFGSPPFENEVIEFAAGGRPFGTVGPDIVGPLLRGMVEEANEDDGADEDGADRCCCCCCDCGCGLLSRTVVGPDSCAKLDGFDGGVENAFMLVGEVTDCPPNGAMLNMLNGENRFDCRMDAPNIFIDRSSGYVVNG